MQKYIGVGYGSDIVIGKIQVYRKKTVQVGNIRIEDVEEELARFHDAKACALEELNQLYIQSMAAFNREQAEILEMHQLLLCDEQYRELIETLIRSQRMSAEYAVQTAGNALAKVFANMEEDCIRAKVSDLQDITERMLSALGEETSSSLQLKEPVILVAENMLPSEVAQLDFAKVLALVLVKASANSHTVILAKSKGIPMVYSTQIDLDDSLSGKLGAVDGRLGKFIVEPDAEFLEMVQERKLRKQDQKIRLETLKQEITTTLDGQRIWMYANIGGLQELELAKGSGTEGIGLFRSEFMYLERDTFPTEEEQFQIYKTVLESMEGKRVVIRTLDIGADKSCDYFGLEQEENPALGCRGIRLCLMRPDIFRTQLRALLRASVYGTLAIMYPMITSVEEVQEIFEIVQEIKDELKEQGIAYGNVTQGIMIETPAAVMLSEELAREADFLSIGTNDLTQYTLALDRQNPKLSAFYDPHHSAVLRMIEMVVKNVHKVGTHVAVCGELAADTAFTKDLLAMGVDELSVAPGDIQRVREAVQKTSIH